MLRRAALSVALLLGASRAEAADRSWSKLDVGMEVATVGALALDMSQTLDIKRHPDWREANVLLGGRPSDARVVGYFAGCMLGHAAVAHLIPHGPWRTAWQAAFFAFEAGVVGRNFAGGVRLSF